MPETGRSRGDLMQFADLGLRLALTVALFSYAGYKLDAWLSTGPWLLIALALAGVAGGMYSVIAGVARWQDSRPPHSKAAGRRPAEPREGGRDEQP